MHHKTIDLSDALATFGTSDFGDQVLKTLDQMADDLPLNRACREGQPRDANVITVSNEREVDGSVLVIALVGFKEVIGGGCANLVTENHRLAYMKVTIERPSGEATVELIEDDDPEPEF